MRTGPPGLSAGDAPPRPETRSTAHEPFRNAGRRAQRWSLKPRAKRSAQGKLVQRIEMVCFGEARVPSTAPAAACSWIRSSAASCCAASPIARRELPRAGATPGARRTAPLPLLGTGTTEAAALRPAFGARPTGAAALRTPLGARTTKAGPLSTLPGCRTTNAGTLSSLLGARPSKTATLAALLGTRPATAGARRAALLGPAHPGRSAARAPRSALLGP